MDSAFRAAGRYVPKRREQAEAKTNGLQCSQCCLLYHHCCPCSRTKQPNSNPGPAECCPYNWTTFRNKCYYFSEEEGDWNSSYEYCSSNNASLARIEEDEESFCKRHDMKRSYWIGVQRGKGETRKWLNGDTAKMKVFGEGECAYWKAQDTSATASRCTSAHQWVCSKSVKSKNHSEI